MVLAVAAFGAFLAFLDSTIVNIAFPDIRAGFPEASLGRLSWVLNAYNIVFAAFLVAAGRLADLLGRRRTFTAGVVVFTVASGLCALAATVEQLIAFRVVQGVGAAMLVPASLALVVEGFEPSRRAHGVGLWGAAAAIASGLGPPVGGALVNAGGWRLAFLVNLPLGVVAVVVARRGLVESRASGRRRMPDLRGAVLLAAGLGLLTLALVQGPDSGWSSALVLGAATCSGLTLAGFALSSRRHPSPLVDPALLRVRSFSVGTVATVVAGAGFYAYLLTHVLYLDYVWGYSLLRAGLAVAPAAFVAAVVAARTGVLADRFGHRVVAVPGALMWAGSLAWYLGRVGTEPAFLTEWLPGQLLQGLGSRRDAADPGQRRPGPAARACRLRDGFGRGEQRPPARRCRRDRGARRRRGHPRAAGRGTAAGAGLVDVCLLLPHGRRPVGAARSDCLRAGRRSPPPPVPGRIRPALPRPVAQRRRRCAEHGRPACPDGPTQAGRGEAAGDRRAARCSPGSRRPLGGGCSNGRPR